MWFCALDTQPGSMQLVLVTQDINGIPQVVEVKRWCRGIDPARVTNQVAFWQDQFQLQADAIVLTPETPRLYASALRKHGHRLELVLPEDVQEFSKVWRELGIHCQARRGEWLCALALARLSPDPTFFNWTPLDWIYAGLSRHVRSIRTLLVTEGHESLSELSRP